MRHFGRLARRHLSLVKRSSASRRIESERRGSLSSEKDLRLKEKPELGREQRQTSRVGHDSYSLFQGASFPLWLETRLQVLEQTEQDVRYKAFLRNLSAVLKEPSIWSQLREERSTASKSFAAIPKPVEKATPLSLLKRLKDAFATNGAKAVNAQLQYTYNGILAGRVGVNIDKEISDSLLDFRFPGEWYPRARELQRVIHLHVGPTNSGKTYHALKALEQAESGLYAGPLRLLAHEVYNRMNASGKGCNLVTGDEQILSDGGRARISSCTVEMVPLNEMLDVAVIDEIQMIGDEHRGWAWTQALLGVRAKEIHLCGEERALPLVRDLVASIGDKLEVHTYSRLSPLRTMSTSLHGNLENLQKGDCVVVFSRVRIHAMKARIELLTGRRVAIVYGGLPPEVRSQQASLFNDPNNDYDYLVASDAIGMGLNLAIKRIVFESCVKSDGKVTQALPINEIKQIAGRAGRYRTAAPTPKKGDIVDVSKSHAQNSADPTVGLVTTLKQVDLPLLRGAMENEAPPILTAGILPPNSVIHKFAAHYPPTISFTYILLRLHELATLHDRFHLCRLKDQLAIADIIHSVSGLSNRDRLIFCYSPFSSRDTEMAAPLRSFARCVAENRSGGLLDFPDIPLNVLDQPVSLNQPYVENLETLHKALILYLWLGYRFAGCFIDRAMAFYVRGLVEEKIDQVLVECSDSPSIRKQIFERQASNRSRKQQQGLPSHEADALLEDLAASNSDSKSVIANTIIESYPETAPLTEL